MKLAFDIVSLLFLSVMVFSIVGIITLPLIVLKQWLRRRAEIRDMPEDA